MLGKLMKHEFRATARVMGPLYLAIAALALGTNFSVHLLNDSSFFPLQLMGWLISIAYFIGMAGLLCVTLVLIINRFRTNLLGDEGYVMFTLPATNHHLICSKLIVSSVWYFATIVVEFLSMFLMALDKNFMRAFFDFDYATLWRVIQDYFLHDLAFFVEIVLAIFTGIGAGILVFYAAMAIGYSFDNHKLALSVVFFFVLEFVLQFVTGIALVSVDSLNLAWQMNGLAAMHTMLWMIIAYFVIQGAAFYGITAHMLKKRLNLE